MVLVNQLKVLISGQFLFYILLQFTSRFGPDGAVNYDYIVTNSLLIGSRCIPNGTHTNHC